MKRFFYVTCVASLSVIGLTLGTFVKSFDSNYKIEGGSALGKAGCAVCHTSKKGGKLNAYGKDLEAAMKKEGTKKLTPSALKAVEGLDSDEDGVKNLAEIKADKLPGAK